MNLSSNRNLIAVAVGCELLISVAFLSLVCFQSQSIEALSLLDIEPIVVESARGAFDRYFFWVIGAFFISSIFTWIDIKNLDFSDKKKIVFYCAMSFFLLYLVLTRALQFPWNQDDSYIDFRYVIHWVENISFDYNPGERAMGFTSHFHLFLLTILGWILSTDSMPVISQGLNIFLQIITFYAGYYLVKSYTKSPVAGLISSAIIALSPYLIQEAIGGKETSLVVVCMIFSLIGIDQKRPHLVAWSSALVLLTRPEGGLWVIIAMIWGYKNFKWGFLKTWIGPLVMLSGVAAWLFAKFGTVIPHGLIGKSTMFYKPPLMADMVLVLRRLADGCFLPEFLFPIGRPISDVGDFFRLYFGVIVLLAMLKFLKDGSFKFYAWTVLSFWLLFSIANPYLFPWYYGWFALVPPILIPVILQKLYPLYKENPKSKNSIMAGILIVYLIGIQIIEQPIRYTMGLPAISFYWSGACKRLVIYKEAAEYASSLDPDQKAYLAAPEIGVLGHYYKGPILDLGGLVSNNIIQYGPAPPELRDGTSLYSIIPKSIEELKPRFLVTDGKFARKGIDKDPYFKENYAVAKFYPHKLWSDGIYLFKRKD